MMEVLASDGDVFLGGQNYDNAIVNWIADICKSKYNYDLNDEKNKMSYARVVEAAEKAKCELSSSTQTEISLPFLGMNPDGTPINFVETINRATFESLTKDLTDQVVEIAKRAIKKAGKTVDDIDEILLVGGSSRIPAVQEALEKAFNKPLNKSCNFDEAVALGAAIQANTVVNGDDNAVLLLDVTPISLGIEVNGCEMGKLIEANTTIPTKKSQIYTTAVDNQPAVTIKVLQGERPMSADNTVIGTFTLDGIAPAPKGVPQIEVTFDINADGILEVTAKDKGTGKEQKVTIDSANKLSDEEIARYKAEAEKYAEADKKKKEEIDKMNNAQGYANQVEKYINDEQSGKDIADDVKESMKSKIAAVNEAVTNKDANAAESARAELEEIFKPIVEKMYQQSQAQSAPQEGQTTTDSASTAGFDDTTSKTDENVQDAEFTEVNE